VTPKLTRVRLLVSDVQACFHLYRDVQGFEVLWADEEGNYVSFKTGDVLLTLNRQDSMTDYGQATFSGVPGQSGADYGC
jgi:catechol 2,3-dioxygenase-like lactoylglutathione lyase family enzyme